MHTANFFSVLFMLTYAGVVCAGPSAEVSESVETALTLERETETLGQIRRQLHSLETRLNNAGDVRTRGGLLLKSGDTAALAAIPSRVVTDTLQMERHLTDTGLVYGIKARNAPVLEIFEAVAKTAGVRLQLHPALGRERLFERVYLDLDREEINGLLEIVAGTQSLGVSLDKNGIFVAPLTAFSERSFKERLGELAVEACQRALGRYPASPEAPSAYLGIARHYRAIGQRESAIEAAERVLERYPKSRACPKAMLLVAGCYEGAGQLETARRVYLRYLDTYPGAADAAMVMMKVGATWMEEEKYAQAIPVFEEVIRTWPDTDDVLLARMRLAECLAAGKQHERAIEQLRFVEKTTRQFTRADELHVMIAGCLARLQRYAAARNYLQKVIRESPRADQAERAYYAMGDVFLAEGQPVAALEAYRGAMREFPDGAGRALAPLRLCRAYVRMGLFVKVEGMLPNLPETVWASPEMRPVILALVRYYLDTAQHRAALKLIADGRWPHDQDTEPELLVLRARANLDGGQLERARELAVAATKIARDEALLAEAERIVGDCYRLVDDRVSAAMAYGGKIQ